MASEIALPPVSCNVSTISNPLHSNSYMTKLFSVTDELCVFMNLPINTKVSVKTAVEFVMNYIKKNGLSSSTDRTNIKSNPELSSLFNIQSEEINVSYYDIHEYIYLHFIDK